jgi:hypothetical protein
MNNTVQSFRNTHIRPVDPKDFAFIRSLAAELPTFTVPSEYILWFFTHFHPDYCRVLENQSGELKAYLLSMPTSAPPNSIAIWQVAASVPNRGFALEYFAAYLREIAGRTGTRSILFTTTLDPGSLRLIRLLSKQFFSCEVSQLDPVPTGQGEFEFTISLGLTSTRCPE